MSASLSGKRPFPAEQQLMRKRAGAPSQVPSGERPVGAAGVSAFELQDLLDAFRHDLMAEIRATVGGAGSGGDGELDGEIGDLKTQVRSLAASIKQTKDELAPLIKTSDANQRIDVMKSELRDVVSGQETATGSILDCMERIEEAAQQIKEEGAADGAKSAADSILDNVVQVFEHCNFQDLSGQRVNKVINTLNFIEARIDAIVAIWGEEDFAEIEVEKEPTGQDDLDRVLAKPTQENERITQDEIDKMFE